MSYSNTTSEGGFVPSGLGEIGGSEAPLVSAKKLDLFSHKMALNLQTTHAAAPTEYSIGTYTRRGFFHNRPATLSLPPCAVRPVGRLRGWIPAQGRDDTGSIIHKKNPGGFPPGIVL